MHKAHAPHRNPNRQPPRPQGPRPQGGRPHGGGGGGGRPHQQQRRQHQPQQQHQHQSQHHAPGPATAAEGLLQFTDDRSDGQLRDPANPLKRVKGDLVVPRQIIRQLQLRPGLLLRGMASGKAMNKIEAIEGQDPGHYAEVAGLYDSTAIDPEPMLKLEHNPAELTTRIMDILCPVGFGQRGLIVAPPRTGKTILLQNIAKGVHANYPNAKLWLLLVDERPEEVTDMRRNVPGTVFASSNDNTVDKHLDLAQLVIERAKRQVEYGHDVVILMDSLTRLGRAFNTGGVSGGRTMTGGLDNRALEIPKKLFGAARKIENGGSLTIMATCLIDTGSAMDKVIFEEFKGTGNMEMTLDRNLANSRIYPALDIASSGTRKEEKLLDPKQLAGSRVTRRHLMNMPPAQAIKNLIEALTKYKTNADLYSTLKT